ncbi:uncharacterized protein YgiM (DUF1202 family) [Janthinobacterium sp. CG_23.3]|uniref:SH3 domain-containing protein n=1 Tax=Janthinobacterium sp. CG_23.3 TaxID=3349634 RepID=UPI0038D46544
MQPDTLYRLAAYAAGLCLTLILAAWLTPRRWWRRPTARALLLLAGGTWGLGSLMLPLFPVTVTAPGGSPSVNPAAAPVASQAYRAHQDLNLRAGAGVNSARIATIPAGAALTPTGVRDGDWWQVSVNVDGHASVGWASSLWLRRAAEAPAP